MNSRSRLIRGGARAVTGLVVVAASATALLLLQTAPLPESTRQPLELVADTTQNAERTLVCPGSFAELGADVTRPGVPIPTGAPTLALSGTPAETAQLTRSEGGDGLPTVYSGPASDPVGAAQIQGLATEELRGAVASVCAEPLNEQWLVGGSTEVGASTVLHLGNPGEVPATVQLALYDENGQIDAGKTAGVIVPPGAQQILSLNGYAPERERLAVRVTSTGAPVTASLGVGQTEVLDPFAVASVTRQQEPSTKLVVPAVTNVNTDHDHEGAGDVGEADQFGVLVRVLGVDDEVGTAKVRAIDERGGSTDLGEIVLVPGSVGELHVDHWPENANAVVIESDTPVVGGVLGSAHDGVHHDYAWFAPAPEIGSDDEVAAPVVGGGQLVIANLGDSAATVEISDASGKAKTREQSVPAGGAVTVKAPAGAVLKSSAPVYAGVRYVRGADIDAYPILGLEARAGEITVYPR